MVTLKDFAERLEPDCAVWQSWRQDWLDTLPTASQPMPLCGHLRHVCPNDTQFGHGKEAVSNALPRLQANFNISAVQTNPSTTASSPVLARMVANA
mmetsp:Transcript_6282/g.11917  ORF Transcript_6282/g.11917 Transcript_6282/m.11917 type:complete len:96 (-) Transcript_6282:743-1030(-)